MVECIFTLDYEIYGNGAGNLRELVCEPTKELISLFKAHRATFVVFAEAIEFFKIDEHKTDVGIREVRDQLCRLRDGGFEIGLHLHPWWFNARRENFHWRLDWTERNLCAAPRHKIDEVLGCAIGYLRDVLGDRSYTPVSFRNGLWLMQPTANMAQALGQHGVKIDSSVFKGGRINELGLDYRPALENGDYWRFSGDVNTPDENGLLLEVPIHSEMVPFWKMLRRKRLGLQKKVPSSANGTPLPGRWRDFARLTYPRKLDFCRMSYSELQLSMERIVQGSAKSPGAPKPIVAIGHSKDFTDFGTVKDFLSYLDRNDIPVSDFRGIISRIKPRNTKLVSSNV